MTPDEKAGLLKIADNVNDLRGRVELLLADRDRWKGVAEVRLGELLDLERVHTAALAEVSRLRDERDRAEREAARILNGNLTAEEFQRLCHNLHERGTPCTAREFAAGCAEFIQQLFPNSGATVSIANTWPADWWGAPFTLGGPADTISVTAPTEPPPESPTQHTGPAPIIFPSEQGTDMPPLHDRLASGEVFPDRVFSHKGMTVEEYLLKDKDGIARVLWVRSGHLLKAADAKGQKAPLFYCMYETSFEGAEQKARDDVREQFEQYYVDDLAHFDALESAARSGASELSPSKQ
jgi:hypothetical protein